MGLPIPQIVLAEVKGQRGKFIVLDGKQRLLSLLQYTGNAQGRNNAFKLSGLQAMHSLTGVKFTHLQRKPELQENLNSLLNHTIRTVVIRNWPSREFLHEVFLRLNTGSVKLSPQELRQAMVPGPFSDFADDWAGQSTALRSLFGKQEPDPRMRDVELFVRCLSFSNYIGRYAGRMKSFLDDSCDRLNALMEDNEQAIREQAQGFESGLRFLLEIFGPSNIARKADSNSFNRAIFDALIFYASDSRILAAMQVKREEVKQAFEETIRDAEFLEAIESDTAGIPHTSGRLIVWGRRLKAALAENFNLPTVVEGKIVFNQFW